MQWWQAVLLVLGGMTAGVINTMAGGGSSLTVPLLTLAGVPGNAANGSNRVGILTSNLAAMAAFKKLGVDGLSHALPVLAPAVVGSLVGSYGINQLTDDTFETVFGLIMIAIILVTLFRSSPPKTADAETSVPDIKPKWATWGTVLAFFLVGIYGGAIQAGIGLVLLSALNRSGYDLVTANSIKVIVTLAVTCVALPVFILQGNVRWLQAFILAIGLTIGGWMGARFTVEGGEVWVRRVSIAAAVALAGKLLGFYDSFL